MLTPSKTFACVRTTRTHVLTDFDSRTRRLTLCASEVAATTRHARVSTGPRASECDKINGPRSRDVPWPGNLTLLTACRRSPESLPRRSGPGPKPAERSLSDWKKGIQDGLVRIFPSSRSAARRRPRWPEEDTRTRRSGSSAQLGPGPFLNGRNAAGTPLGRGVRIRL